jgi:hypothetical protein
VRLEIDDDPRLAPNLDGRDSSDVGHAEQFDALLRIWHLLDDDRCDHHRDGLDEGAAREGADEPA